MIREQRYERLDLEVVRVLEAPDVTHIRYADGSVSQVLRPAGV